MRDLGTKSQVEIEPKLATEILDYITDLLLVKNGYLVFAVCPGAGGHDDLALLVKSNHKLDILKLLRKDFQINKFKANNIFFN